MMRTPSPPHTQKTLVTEKLQPTSKSKKQWHDGIFIKENFADIKNALLRRKHLVTWRNIHITWGEKKQMQNKKTIPISQKYTCTGKNSTINILGYLWVKGSRMIYFLHIHLSNFMDLKNPEITIYKSECVSFTLFPIYLYIHIPK